MLKIFISIFLIACVQAQNNKKIIDANGECTIINNYINYGPPLDDYNQRSVPGLAGPPGKRGPPGMRGERGLQGPVGKSVITEKQKQEMFQGFLSELANLPRSCKEVVGNKTAQYWLLLDGRPVYKLCNFSEPHTCDDVKPRTNGYYKIYPGGNNVVTAFCNVTGTLAITSFEHDSMSEIKADKCKYEGCYTRNVRYSATMPQMVALIQASNHCRQYIKYKCIRSAINWKLSQFAWWQDRNGTKMPYWGGATSHRRGYCACGETDSCADSSKKCNCDHNANELPLTDEGYLDDKSRLPVTQMNFGDTDEENEDGWHTLGPLECYNDSN